MAPEPSLEAVDDLTDHGVDLPADWTLGARDAFLTVLDARPDLDGPEWVALEQAASLISSATQLDDVAREAGFVTVGSKGQPVLHPAATEARLARVAASQIMARLVPVKTHGAITPTERARSAARARWASQATRSRAGK